MSAIELYGIEYDIYPDQLSDLEQVGYQPTPDVEFTRFKRENKDGAPSVHMHAGHLRSPYYYHAHYPGEGQELDKRNN